MNHKLETQQVGMSIPKYQLIAIQEHMEKTGITQRTDVIRMAIDHYLEIDPRKVKDPK